MSEPENPAVARRASDLAYLQGKRDAQVDGTLESHEQRLGAINGSIDRAATAHRNLEEAVARLGRQLTEKIDEVAALQTTRVAVEKDRAEAVKQANEKQVSTRAFAIGVALVFFALLGAIAAFLTYASAAPAAHAGLILGGLL